MKRNPKSRDVFSKMKFQMMSPYPMSLQIALRHTILRDDKQPQRAPTNPMTNEHQLDVRARLLPPSLIYRASSPPLTL